MTGNSPGPTPTPFPDPPDHGAKPLDKMPAEHLQPDPLPPPITGFSTSSGDDIYALLALPDPDPMLHGSPEDAPVASSPEDSPGDAAEAAHSVASVTTSGSDYQLPILLTPPPEITAGSPFLGASPRPVHGDQRVEAAATPRAVEQAEVAPPDANSGSWPFLLVASYASAVTLALIWILWTGRGLQRFLPSPGSDVENGRFEAGNSGARPPFRRAPPLPAQNLASLGSSIRLGDLEIAPTRIERRTVNLDRLDGSTGETREAADALVLALRLTSRSSERRLTPLEPAFVRDPSPNEDQAFIETENRRIPMFHLALESEWSITDQRFRALEPGETAETIIVSQPVAMSDLAGPLVWHIKLRTGTYRTDVVGVRFTMDQIDNQAR